MQAGLRDAILLTGPTASGKSALALALAEGRNGTRHLQVYYSGLNDGKMICHVDLENLSHTRELNHDTFV